MRIETGDYVEVIWNELSFDGKSKNYGKVIYIPSGTGDMWHIECKNPLNNSNYVLAVNPQSSGLDCIILVHKGNEQEAEKW